MPLEADREIFDIAEHTAHVTFQKTTRKAAFYKLANSLDRTLPSFPGKLLIQMKTVFPV